ncbi:unnamed protein product, partial [Polarella glacialis]
MDDARLTVIVPDHSDPQDQPSLLRLLLQQLEELWHGAAKDKAWKAPKTAGNQTRKALLSAPYRPKAYLRRRAPDEIEAVLTQLDQGALDMVKSSFSAKSLDLTHFAEAIVRTGTYDAERVLAFIAGIVDLYLEVLRSQSERAEGGDDPAVNWAQLMNHFIESPEIAMFEGSEVTGGMGKAAVTSHDKVPQVHRSNFVDGAKHMGSGIEKISWIPFIDMLTTVEGTESVYFWSPSVVLDAPRSVTPTLPGDCYDQTGKALWTVLACAWDNELQDLVALLSNRLLVVWRLRNREKGQFQQKRELRFNAHRAEGRAKGGEKETYWKVFLASIDPKTGEDLHKDPKKHMNERSEAAARREKRD